MNGRRARIVAGLATALLLAACSNNSGSDSGQLTKTQYIARADRICKAANDKSAALGAPTGTDPQSLATFLQKSGKIVTDAVAQLKRLNPPQADQQKISKLIDGLQKSASLFPALVKAVRAQDTQKIQSVANQLRQASQEGAQIARTYGFHVCAHSAGTAANPTP